LASLAKAVDTFVADNKSKRMAAFVILLDEKSEANQKKLADLAKAGELSVPLTIAADGAKGPGAYKIHADVPITVLVSSRNRVQANFALAGDAPSGEEALKKEAEPILAAAKKLLEE